MAQMRAKAATIEARDIRCLRGSLEHGMATREDLLRLIDELPEDRAELARVILEDLNEAADEDGEPLSSEEHASLDRGLADIQEGRVKPLREYERERGL